ncbi:MAG: phosphodiester glycosidase family protein [Erysipelotrichaceae bacterium]|nr:phosphodiester glycosidase family protein [Erysipelotrichaceae bacterium]
MKNRTLNRVLLLLDCLALLFLTVLYGPFDSFRNWYVTTALSTSSHKYLAHIFYSDSQLESIMSNNQIEVLQDSSDSSLITVSNPSDQDDLTKLEKLILNNPENADYQIIPISGNGYSGWLTVIYDPTRLDLVTAQSDNGSTVSALAQNNNALVAVNGGGFDQSRKERSADGGLISNRQIICLSEESEQLISMTTDGKLLLVNSTVQQLSQSQDISWALHFSPFLIVNGISANVSGNAGGQQPRTAIGQRADGIIILMTIDGRGSNGSFGINYAGMIELFEQCGCINAANLDGGGSTTLYENGKLINDPANRRGTERKVYDALIFS